MKIDDELVKEAKSLGINASMYCLISPDKREKALRLDIESRRKEVAKWTDSTKLKD